MESYSYWIRTYQGDISGTSMVGHADDLAIALHDAVQSASYYHFVCGYRVTIEVNRICAHCKGTGVVGKRTKRTCQKCDWGTIPFLPEFEFSIHQNAVELLHTGSEVSSD